MQRSTRHLGVARAAWRTWGLRGIPRRALYEATKRGGRLRRLEDRWLEECHGDVSLRLLPIVPIPASDCSTVAAPSIRLYGWLELETPVPPRWQRHPLTGYDHPPSQHWADLSDAAPSRGDIKDIWELSRLGWLHRLLRDAAGSTSGDSAEAIWLVIEDWADLNRAYRGPNWMCGQEASLRGINLMFMASALAPRPATTATRLQLCAELVGTSVGRVRPTLRYALSQRNNHAISEAGFLWTSAVLLEGLPDARKQKASAAKALSEAVTDQFLPDGSYAQHSPTYQRLALHVLLWCLFVSRETGEKPPAGVTEAVGRSVPFLRSLVAPGSEGRVPNLGGNDGALLFGLTPQPITDLRPVIAHAAAATGQPSGFDAGPWDEELLWFGLTPTTGRARSPGPSVNTHALTVGSAHAVLRAGPLRHRPAHADQMHTDVWLGGAPVAVDAGSYRYTAPLPWMNALADEQVHNLPTKPGIPQAERAGRFFWRRWTEAELRFVITMDGVVAAAATLILSDGTHFDRLVVTRARSVLVIDESTATARVRWNLVGGPTIEPEHCGSRLVGPGWSAAIAHSGRAELLSPSEGDPTSGWHAPTYGVREPLTALIVPIGEGSKVVSHFFLDGVRNESSASSLLGSMSLRDSDPRELTRALEQLT